MRILIPAIILGFISTTSLVMAETPLNLEKPGPYALETMEFPDLHDPARNNRHVPIKIHYPKEKGPWPVVVVSHGAGGGWDANYAQARHLASYGYMVLCLEHMGSNTARMKKGLRFMKNLKEMTRDTNELFNRPKDVTFAINSAETWNKDFTDLRGRFDLDHIGVLGHSYGAYTTLVVCGVRPALDWLNPPVPPGKGIGPDLSDPRVDAGVALSPQGPGEPYFHNESYSYLKRPVLGISGTRDKQQGAPPENRLKYFENIPTNGQIFIWLNNVDHMAFSDSTGTGKINLPSRSRDDAQPLVRAATLLFFNLHLKGDKAADAALSKESLQPLIRGVVDGLEVYRK
jgi:predicted dienelactone hydrolase